MVLSADRKRLHLGCSLVALAVAFLPFPIRSILAAVAFIIMHYLDHWRLQDPDHERYRNGVWEKCLRREEKGRLTGSWWLCLGFLAISFVPSKEAIVLAVIYAGFADPIAEIFGHYFYSRDYRPVSRKTFAGSLGFFAAGFSFSFLALTFLFREPQTLLLSSIGSLWATFVEALEPKIKGHYLNDNFLVPVTAALFFWLILSLY